MRPQKTGLSCLLCKKATGRARSRGQQARLVPTAPWLEVKAALRFPDSRAKAGRGGGSWEAWAGPPPLARPPGTQMRLTS